MKCCFELDPRVLFAAKFEGMLFELDASRPKVIAGLEEYQNFKKSCFELDPRVLFAPKFEEALLRTRSPIYLRGHT